MNEKIDKESIMSKLIFNPNAVKRLILSPMQIEIMKWMIDNYYGSHVTSTLLASDLHKTIPNTSMQLGKLANKGYLYREKVRSTSGGRYFRYKLTYTYGIDDGNNT